MGSNYQLLLSRTLVWLEHSHFWTQIIAIRQDLMWAISKVLFYAHVFFQNLIPFHSLYWLQTLNQIKLYEYHNLFIFLQSNSTLNRISSRISNFDMFWNHKEMRWTFSKLDFCPLPYQQCNYNEDFFLSCATKVFLKYENHIGFFSSANE